MKYMTFNSSCSYAGLANLLAFYDIDVSDREIALDMGLPYLFAKDQGKYLAGPMLQSEEWFNLFLRPHGFMLREREILRDQMTGYLRESEHAMLGIRVSPGSKHAVIYDGREGEKYRFLNNKWENSEEPDTLLLSEEELLNRLDDKVMVAVLERAAREEVDKRYYYEKSAVTLEQLLQDVEKFCAIERSPEELRNAMDTLFRAILLDGITMLELLSETEIRQKLKTVQSQLLAAVRENCDVRLDCALDLNLLQEGIREYCCLIRKQAFCFAD